MVGDCQKVISGASTTSFTGAYKIDDDDDDQQKWCSLVWFLLFNGISTFVGYLIPKPSF